MILPAGGGRSFIHSSTLQLKARRLNYSLIFFFSQYLKKKMVLCLARVANAQFSQRMYIGGLSAFSEESWGGGIKIKFSAFQQQSVTRRFSLIVGWPGSIPLQLYSLKLQYHHSPLDDGQVALAPSQTAQVNQGDAEGNGKKIIYVSVCVFIIFYILVVVHTAP